jgi:hypothetical protein
MSSSALFRKDTSRKTECKVCCGTGAVLTTATVERLGEGEGAGCSLCEILRRAVLTHAPGRPSDEEIALAVLPCLYIVKAFFGGGLGSGTGQRVARAANAFSRGT